MQRIFFRALVLLFLAPFLAMPVFSKATAESEKRPNIIFILADDLGYGELGCYGQKLIKTPHLDRLAAEGMRFTQAYAGSTVCAPSRCALMTGFHTGHARIRANERRPLLPEDVTIAEVLKNAGYRTGLIGKWGLGNENTTGAPPEQGFDYSFGYLDQHHAHEYWTDHLFRNGKRVEVPARTWSHDLFAREALDFVRREKSNRFFLYLAYTIPHLKFDPPTDAPYSNENWNQTNKNIAAMITRMDSDIGDLMALLKELRLDENTIVFFTSDNGPRRDGSEFFSGAGPLRGIKRDLYEGGIRVPMIVRWPGKIKAGAASDHVWAFWDVLPTLGALAGAKTPPGIDGVSVLPALLGKAQKPQPFLYWEFYERGFQQAVRMGDWKAIRHAPGEALELFNLKRDVGEKENVATANPKVIQKIEAFLQSARVPFDNQGLERKTRRSP